MKQRVKLGSRAKLGRWGYFFVIPFITVFAVFNLWPTLYTFMLSFTNLKGLRADFEFAGGVNFIRLVNDKNFWGAVGNTFIMWGMNFGPQIGMALLLSVWLSNKRLKLKGKGFFRAVIYLPNLLTTAAVAMLFRSLFGFPTGPVNQFLWSLGIGSDVVKDGVVVREAINFFRNVNLSRGIVAFIQWWMWYGHTVILLMAGITSIPDSLTEAAVVDGATYNQITWRITLPLLRPMMLYILVTSMIGGMQMLEIPFLLTDMRGAPDFKIRTTAIYIYNIAFQGVNDYAYAAAISVGVFLITLVLAMFIFFFLQDRSDLKKKKIGG